MSGRVESALERHVVYCLVPRELAPRLHDLLRRHFREDHSIEVIVERRGVERRRADDRRLIAQDGAPADRRLTRSLTGRRIGERRVALVHVPAPELPRKARRFAQQIVFVERLQPASVDAEDLDTARLVASIQAGQRDAFTVLYARYFDRVYGYLRPVLRNHHEAEDVAQQVFLDVLAQLPEYERRGVPFRAWLFTLAKNQAIDRLRRLGRLELSDMGTRADQPGPGELVEPSAEMTALNWISDRELLRFIERLPLSQRQVLLLRYMLGFSSTQTAEVLGRSVNEVRLLQHRAHAVLRQRFLALGVAPKYAPRTKAPIRFRQVLVLRHRRFALHG